MNRRSYTVGIFLILFLAGFLLNPTYRARAEDAWEILLNGTVSKVSVRATDSGEVLPIYFPVPPEGESREYGVRIESDPLTRQIKVMKVEKKARVRDPGDCVKCEGDEKCQDCYPAGSGVNTAGTECYTCNATGECTFCHGSGECYSCDGHGFPTGCNTCGLVADSD